MPSKTAPSGGLSAASNPSARLQQLLRQDGSHTEKNTEKNTDTLAEKITETYTPENAELMADDHAEGNAKTIADILPEAQPEPMVETTPATRPQRRKPIRTEAGPPPTTNSIRQRLVEDLQKEPVIRKTIDIPASLNERLQDYCAAKRIKTERRVFLVLLENFLEEEGF